jgi:hypothetical protein
MINSNLALFHLYLAHSCLDWTKRASVASHGTCCYARARVATHVLLLTFTCSVWATDAPRSIGDGAFRAMWARADQNLLTDVRVERLREIERYITTEHESGGLTYKDICYKSVAGDCEVTAGMLKYWCVPLDVRMVSCTLSLAHLSCRCARYLLCICHVAVHVVSCAPVCRCARGLMCTCSVAVHVVSCAPVLSLCTWSHVHLSCRCARGLMCILGSQPPRHVHVLLDASNLNVFGQVC